MTLLPNRMLGAAILAILGFLQKIGNVFNSKEAFYDETIHNSRAAGNQIAGNFLFLFDAWHVVGFASKKLVHGIVVKNRI